MFDTRARTQIHQKPKHKHHHHRKASRLQLSDLRKGFIPSSFGHNTVYEKNASSAIVEKDTNPVMVVESQERSNANPPTLRSQHKRTTLLSLFGALLLAALSLHWSVSLENRPERDFSAEPPPIVGLEQQRPTESLSGIQVDPDPRSVSDFSPQRRSGEQHVDADETVTVDNRKRENHERNHPFEPINVLEQYMTWHSEESLKSDPHGRSRIFAVGHYACPSQAGNRLHHFFNAFLWAVVTNRTLLWHYYDRKACRQLGKGYDPRICHRANTLDECDQVLDRATWLPSFDAWNSTLELDDPIELDFWTTHPRALMNATLANSSFSQFHFTGSRKHPWPYNNTTNSSSRSGPVQADALATSSQTVIFPIMADKYHDLAFAEYRNELLVTADARERARKLYSQGADFLYGMLFRHTFAIRPELTFKADHESDGKDFSIAMHSRHANPTDKGKKIPGETKCFKKIVRLQPHGTRCKLYFFADRINTLNSMKTWLSETSTTNCTLVLANHKRGMGIRPEHGPYAGVGFFQDLDMAARARHAFVGGKRSSSDLALELIEYDRRMEAWHQGQTSVKPLHICSL